jgi:hypothetical protein
MILGLKRILSHPKFDLRYAFNRGVRIMHLPIAVAAAAIPAV